MTPSKPWPWNKLKKPTPADWGNGMTVCISAICENDDGIGIIAASDRMVSMGGYFSGDDMARKVDALRYNWVSMIAGDDISPFIPILRRAHANTDHVNTLESVTSVIKTAYKDQRLEQIEDEVLQPYGLTWDRFHRSGKDELTDRTYEKIREEIKKYSLSLEILVGGYDPSGVGHIFTVESPGKCSYYDKLGFWAIGSGQHQAVNSLFSTKYNSAEPLEMCIAKVLAAKLTAETAVGVGKETWILVLRPGHSSYSFVPKETQKIYRTAWDKLPRIPMDTLPSIKTAIEAELAKDAERNKEYQEAQAKKAAQKGMQ
jgi:hypothetical protein